MGVNRLFRRESALSTREKIIALFIIAIIVMTGIQIFNKDPVIPEYIEPPNQIDLTNNRTIDHQGRNGTVEITLLAEYNITGVVKSRKNYSTDSASAVSPMDLVLAWGDLNQKDIDKKITYSQSNRWYYTRIKERFDSDYYKIQTQSSNTHIIPADDHVLKQLKKIKKNDLIELNGYLVKVVFDPKQPAWTSSLTRHDSGDKSCEIMYVKEVIRR